MNKISLLILLLLLSTNAISGTYQGGACDGLKSTGHTNFCLKNLNNEAVRLGVTNVDNHDWDGNSRPDKNLNGVTLSPNEKICRRLEINCYASNSAFTLTVNGEPTRVWYMTLGSSYVHGWGAEFKGPRSKTKYTYDLRGQTVAKYYLECTGKNCRDIEPNTGFAHRGWTCAGSDCAMFEIGPKKRPE